MESGHSLSLRLLKGFEVMRDGESVPLTLSSQRVVAFLALQERAVPRSYVAGTLWVDSSEAHSSANLRSCLWRIGCVTRDLVEVGKRELQLAPNVVVDVREVARFAHAQLSEAEPRDAASLHDHSLLDDLLPGWYEDWVLLERERLRQLCLHALERLCARLTAQGQYAEAIEAGLAAVRSEPIRESAHRVLIAAHLAEGNRAEARRQYRAYERVLRQELGLAPSPELRGVAQDLGI
jgi:DNA-binding SARP family transcriptional activator